MIKQPSLSSLFITSVLQSNLIILRYKPNLHNLLGYSGYCSSSLRPIDKFAEDTSSFVFQAGKPSLSYTSLLLSWYWKEYIVGYSQNFTTCLCTYQHRFKLGLVRSSTKTTFVINVGTILHPSLPPAHYRDWATMQGKLDAQDSLL